MNNYFELMRDFGVYYIYIDENNTEPRPATEREIATLEREIGYKLPHAYRQFITNYGGGGGFAFAEGSVSFPIHDFPPGRDGSSLFDVIFGVKTNNRYDLLETYQDYKGRMPPELLPIGTDPGGNMICLTLAGEHTGTVYFWDHEQEPMALSLMEPVPTDYSNVYRVADSFDEFMQSLKIDDE